MAMATAPIAAYDVADSTDWLATPLSDLMPIESSLRCQVCKDFYTTPMITSCSHTFCSLCIRRYLSQEGKCPACREPDQEIRLRRNWAIEELVAAFVQARDGLLRFARAMTAGNGDTTASSDSIQEGDDGESEAQRPKKRRKVVDAGSNGAVRRSTRSRLRQLGASQQAVQEEGEDASEGEEEDNGSVYEDEPEPDGLVACPSCSRRIKEAVINSHLDRCLSGTATPPPAAPFAQPLQVKAGTIAYTQTKPSSISRLPTINYSLLNESRLRSKLRDLGIRSTGSKELMSKRHTEWVNLWNANCDSLQQLSKRDLLRQLDTWERTQGRQIDHKEVGGGGVMVRDFDRKGYMQARKGEFDALIAEARARARAAAAAKGSAGQMEDNDGKNEEEKEEKENGQSSEQVNGDNAKEGIDMNVNTNMTVTTMTTTATIATTTTAAAAAAAAAAATAATAVAATSTTATTMTTTPPDTDPNQDHDHNHDPIAIRDSPIKINHSPVLW